jgi:putative protease
MVWKLGQIEVRVESPAPLGEAAGHPLGEALLRAQLGRLGHTPYELGSLDARIEGRPFAPASLLNHVRREAVERLQELQLGRAHRIEVPAADAVAEAVANVPRRAGAALSPKLHLLVRSPSQLEAAIALRPESITLDYLDLYGLKPSVERVLAAGIEARAAAPRILKPSEQRVEHFLRKLGCPILVRSAGLLEAFRRAPGPELHGDFSLNAANAVSAAVLLDMGLARLAPTHDLNARQIRNLAEALPAEAVEVIAYHHLPVFHTEHCVFCRFLSAGTSHEDCGHPCEKHQVALRDASGRAHPVLADVGCRNTVFGAEAQQAARHLDSWRAAGIVHFRLEFAHESAEEIEGIAGAFREALGGRIRAGELERRLRRHAPQGVTEGSFFIPASALAGAR